MLVIAENLNVRNRVFMDALKKGDKKLIGSLAKELEDKGPDIINIQCTTDGAGDEKLLPLAAEAVQAATGLPLCLDSRNVEALEKTLSICNDLPVINYLALDDPHADRMLELVNKFKAELIIRAIKGAVPITLEAKLLMLEGLIEKANAADIPNERLYADPSVVHIGRGMGQDHLLNTHACIGALNEMVDPPINTIAWISNVSTGLPSNLRPRMNASFLCYLAGAGLQCALLDVTDPEVMKMVYLVRSFRDEIIFSPSDIS